MTDPAASPAAHSSVKPGADWESAALWRYRRYRVPHRRRHREDHDQPARDAQRVPPADAVRAARRLQRRPATTTRSASSSSPARATWRSAPAATSASAATTATSATTTSRARASAGSTCSTCRSRSAGRPSRSSRWSPGYAIGGGHVLHVVCDLSIAADNARFGQTGPKVGSFDGGYGSGLLARQIGQKRAREIWFLCRQYGAATGATTGAWSTRSCRSRTSRSRRCAGAARCSSMSPLALRMLKASHQRRRRRAGRHPAARRRRDAAVLHDRGGAGGPRRLQGQAQARLRQVPQASLMPQSLASARRAARRRGRVRAAAAHARSAGSTRARGPADPRAVGLGRVRAVRRLRHDDGRALAGRGRRGGWGTWPDAAARRGAGQRDRPGSRS